MGGAGDDFTCPLLHAGWFKAGVLAASDFLYT